MMVKVKFDKGAVGTSARALSQPATYGERYPNSPSAIRKRFFLRDGYYVAPDEWHDVCLGSRYSD